MLQDPLKVMSIIHKERELYEISSDPQYAEREERECIHFSDLVFFFIFIFPPSRSVDISRVRGNKPGLATI